MICPCGNEYHQLQVTTRLGFDSPCPGETHVGTSVSMSRFGQVKIRVIRSGSVTVSEQCKHILMLPRWVPETPAPVVAQVGPETRGPGEFPMGTTVTRSGEAMLRIRVTSYR